MDLKALNTLPDPQDQDTDALLGWIEGRIAAFRKLRQA